MAGSTHETLMALRPHLSIADHEPGRVRLTVDLGGLFAVQGKASAEDLETLKGLDGIEGVDLNPFTRSLTIDYDSARIEPAWWDSLIEGGDESARDVLVKMGLS